MFLTKIELDPARRLARKYLGSPQVMHAVVMKAASKAENDDPNTGPQGRVLWRVDQGAFGVSLYILSPHTPAMDQLVQDAASPGDQARTLDYNGFLERLTPGQIWAFRLTANPARSVSRGPGVRGKRHGHVTVAQQQQWLMDRSEKNGFTLVPPPVASESSGNTDENERLASSLAVVRRDKPVFGRQNPDGSRQDRVTINRVVYEGVLRVTDAELLRRLLVSGIGPSKAYGCGLMTLARPR